MIFHAWLTASVSWSTSLNFRVVTKNQVHCQQVCSHCTKMWDIHPEVCRSRKLNVTDLSTSFWACPEMPHPFPVLRRIKARLGRMRQDPFRYQVRYPGLSTRSVVRSSWENMHSHVSLWRATCISFLRGRCPKCPDRTDSGQGYRNFSSESCLISYSPGQRERKRVWKDCLGVGRPAMNPASGASLCKIHLLSLS